MGIILILLFATDATFEAPSVVQLYMFICSMFLEKEPPSHPYGKDTNWAVGPKM